MKKAATISISKGKGSLSHTDRTNTRSPSIDITQMDQNIVIVNKSIKEVYDELFHNAVEDYNLKQISKGHEERQIKNYLEKIERSKQEKPFYEFIFEIGNTNTYDHGSIDDKIFNSILKEYAEEFEKRNPNFKVIKSIIHNDEPLSLGHLHIDFVPFSTGNKRGLETKNSISGALNEMGYGRQGFNEWRNTELEHLKTKLLARGYEFELGSGRTHHFSNDEFKAITQHNLSLIKNKMTTIPLEMNTKKTMLNKEKVIVNKNELDQLIERAKLSIVHENTSQELNELLHEERKDLKATCNNYKNLYNKQQNLNERYDQQNIEIKNLQSENKKLKDENEKFKGTLLNFSKHFHGVCKSLKNVIQALNLLKWDNNDNDYYVELDKKQSTLIHGLENYAKTCLTKEDQHDMVEDIENYVGVSEDIKKEIEKLDSKQKHNNLSR